MRVAPEPSDRHGTRVTAARTAILLCNLGTPDAPTPGAVRRYLREFLSDPRVVEIPKIFWWPILHGIVLRVRPAKSAAKYASIWMADGSPLRVWTDKQSKLLQGYLGERCQPVRVRYAMRYGSPSVASVLDELLHEGATRVLVLPLYPQYSGTTTASLVDAVQEWTRSRRVLPELRFVNQFHDDPGYIDALAQRVAAHSNANGQPEKMVLSFHGIPQRVVDLGDPYQRQCEETARLLIQRLRLDPGQVTVTFQSRFGKARWLQPYTEPTLVSLARQGLRRVDVMCPGFPADCLETLEEINAEARHAFVAAGGKEFHYIPCLNDQHEWIAALSAIALRHLQGWPHDQGDSTAQQHQQERSSIVGTGR